LYEIIFLDKNNLSLLSAAASPTSQEAEKAFAQSGRRGVRVHCDKTSLSTPLKEFDFFGAASGDCGAAAARHARQNGVNTLKTSPCFVLK